MSKLRKKVAKAIVDNPIELTADDLKELIPVGAFRKNNRVCIAARTEFPIFVWKENGTKDKCPAGGFVVLDEDGVLKLLPPEKFEGDYEPLRVPSFYDSAIFFPAPQPDPVDPVEPEPEEPVTDPVVDNPPA